MTFTPVHEPLRSRCWAAAKPVAIEAWNRGSPDTTQMLISASRGLDAALAEVVQPRLNTSTAEIARLRAVLELAIGELHCAASCDEGAPLDSEGCGHCASCVARLRALEVLAGAPESGSPADV